MWLCQPRGPVTVSTQTPSAGAPWQSWHCHPCPLPSCLAPLLPVPCQGGSRPRRHLSMLARAGSHQGLVGRCKGLPSTFGMGEAVSGCWGETSGSNSCSTCSWPGWTAPAARRDRGSFAAEGHGGSLSWAWGARCPSQQDLQHCIPIPLEALSTASSSRWESQYCTLIPLGAPALHPDPSGSSATAFPAQQEPQHCIPPAAPTLHPPPRGTPAILPWSSPCPVPVPSLGAAGARPQRAAAPGGGGGSRCPPCLLSASEKLTLKRAGRALQLNRVRGV